MIGFLKEVEYGKIYTGADWNRIIEIKVKEEYNTKLLLKEINQMKRHCFLRNPGSCACDQGFN